MSDLTRLDHRLDAKALTCRAVIETPKGRRGKLAYDPGSGAFELKRMLPDGMSFPLDFGFVPGTRGEDGDPLDILVLGDEPSAVGTLLTVRLIGVMEAEQTEDGKTVRNDRMLAVASVSHLFGKVKTVEDLDADFVRNLAAFWENYDALRGVQFKLLVVRDGPGAASLIAG
ncbi:MAG: inorganic diphosphatase [Caulobacter sp.]|nr:inorganic diphosphatase [Caulobacter sp.]